MASIGEGLRKAFGIASKRLIIEGDISEREMEQFDASYLARSWFTDFLDHDSRERSYLTDEDRLNDGIKWFREARNKKKEIDAARAQLPQLGLRAFVRALVGL